MLPGSLSGSSSNPRRPGPLRPDPGESDFPSRRFAAVLPVDTLTYRPPRWWQEVAVVAAGYWLYGLARNAIDGGAGVARDHGHAVQRLQERLHLDPEPPLNRWVAAHEPLAQAMNYYYATLHFAVTIGTMVWLFRAHPRLYRGARTVLLTTTLIALLGFYLYPLAPPRLLPGYGYVDTLVRFHTWGSLADPRVAERSNQYAAMPSLHVAWASWVGICVFMCARRSVVRWAGLAYPALTVFVVLGTANHFLFDAVGASVALGLGFTVQYALSGHAAFRPAPLAVRENPASALVAPPARQASACGS
ncbi:MAG: phosphatase PAP2 family protein [bacterium]